MSRSTGKSLSAAMLQVGTPPCERFSCPHIERCKALKQCCSAFRLWTVIGDGLPRRRVLPLAVAIDGPDMTLAQWVDQCAARESAI